MTLLETIRNDMKTAMKAKDMHTLDTVRMVLASVKNKAIDLGRELEDADVLAVITSDVKKLKDGLESFVAAAREDLAEQARKEIHLLEKYLPAQMSDEELEGNVRAILAEIGVADAADMGKAMGQLMARLKGVADGGRVKAMAQKILQA